MEGSFFLENHQKRWGNGWVLTRTMAEKNGNAINPWNSCGIALGVPTSHPLGPAGEVLTEERAGSLEGRFGWNMFSGE